jgi:putative methyltransferase (TIGR04325 family)
VDIEYYCHDVPLLCQAGSELLPGAHFLGRRSECFSRRYDFVLASSSAWYEEDWRMLLNHLSAVADPYLYITRMIFVERAASYVAIQRPSSFGYQTEYLCWILNRHEFLAHVLSSGMELVREFLICDAQHIHRAPEQGDYRGFLFRRQEASRQDGEQERSQATSSISNNMSRGVTP